jgi:hypothetical protein
MWGTLLLLGAACLAAIAFLAPNLGQGPEAGSPDRTLAFETVVRGATVGPAPEVPTVYMATTSSELTAWLGFLSPAHQLDLQGVDLTTHILLAVFAGPQGNASARLTVPQVAVNGANWQILVDRRQPEPGEVSEPVVNTPYEVVRVPRAVLEPLVAGSWMLRDTQGTVLGTGITVGP